MTEVFAIRTCCFIYAVVMISFWAFLYFGSIKTSRDEFVQKDAIIMISGWFWPLFIPMYIYGEWKEKRKTKLTRNND